MEHSGATGSAEIAGQVRRATRGDREAWDALLAGHRDRLRRMVALRLDRRLRGRVDASDVIQEAFLEATNRLADYAADPSPMPFFLWLRFLVGQRLQILHRRHLGAQARDAARELSIDGGALPAASSAALAARLLGHFTSASSVAMRLERKARLRVALDAMDPLDREILVLRHFEELTNREAAQTLRLQESAASKRYIRALRKLKDILRAMPGGSMEFRP